MTIEDYFGKWTNVVPVDEVCDITADLTKSNKCVCPAIIDVFKAFEVCPY